MKKRLLCIWLCLLLTAPSGAALAESAPVGGDGNGDGRVDASDAAAVLRTAMGLAEADNAAAVRMDVTGNQAVGTADAQAILLFCAGRLQAFRDLLSAAHGGLLGESQLPRFSYQGVQKRTHSYQSAQVSVTVSAHAQNNLYYYVADIYVQDITSLFAAFGSGGYGQGRALTKDLAAENAAVIAVNGDGYSGRTLGPMVRNGVWYRRTVDPDADICVLCRSGELKVYDAGSVEIAAIEADDPYQTWVCGPRLMDDAGQPVRAFANSLNILERAARTCIGYYAPGHYCLVTVDGTSNPLSEGATLTELSDIMVSLGCKAAYNLTGGQSAAMAPADGLVSVPHTRERTVSDIICIREPQGMNG